MAFRMIFITLLASLVSAFDGSIDSNQACPISPRSGPISRLTNFPDGTWVENLHLRADGLVLASIYEPSGRLVLINPEAGTVQNVTTLANTNTGALGIAEIEADVYYFLSVVHGASVTTYPYGSGQVWSVNVSEFLMGDGAEIPATFVANLTESICPNGATAIPETGSVLAADSQAGVIWRIDAYTGDVRVAANDTLLRNTSVEGLGVNGVHVKDGYAFFTNTDLNLYGRIPIDEDGIQTGPVEELVPLPFGGVDDFALFGHDDWALLAGDPSNGTYFVAGTGEQCVVKLNDLVGPTAMKIQTTGDRSAEVWVSTDGGFLGYKQHPVRVAGSLSKFTIEW